MSASRKLLLFFILLFARAVSADGGDDFANNLFSDLGPLLALFGERVTMQFMSGSMCWADNIILAMAPLGIITAIVGAIRVGGPSWLKAVIGRARENLAIAEAELMSSTSHEVCELWNGEELVRHIGPTSVIEFICLLPKNGHMGEVTTEIGEFDPLTAECDRHLEPIDLSIKTDLARWRVGIAARDSEDNSMREPLPRVVIKRNLSLGPPNISLNTHPQTSRGELRIVAAFGTILQLSVLIYSGFATYHPALRFKKDDNPIASYAYPCTVVGTVILVVGMMLCAHVVESSTAEQRFQSKPWTNLRVRVVWLQLKKTDQEFGSFAIYAKDDQAFITTSRRSPDFEFGQSQSTKDGKDSKPDGSNEELKSQTNHAATGTKNATTTLQIKTVLGTTTCLTGFILQFVGLRGLHWSTSIAQLGAVLLMVCLKAWIRRGLSTPPNALSIPPGYELDWFAKTLRNIDQAPWNVVRDHGESRFRGLRNLARTFDRKASTSPFTQSEAEDALESSTKDFGSQWRIASTGSGHLGNWKRTKPQRDEQYEEQDNDQEDEQTPSFTAATAPTSWSGSALTSLNSRAFVDSAVSDAQKVLDMRMDLGHVARWWGTASSKAVSLARAIEVTMNTLIGSSPMNISAPTHLASPNTFYWSLDACNHGLDDHPINFQLQRYPDGKWKACANEYEAALSLWLSSVQGEKSREVGVSVMRTKNSTYNNDDARLRIEESKEMKLGLRLLGLRTTALLQDLRWWVPKDLLRVIEVQEYEQKPQQSSYQQEIYGEHVFRIETHRVIGYSQQEMAWQETRDGTPKNRSSILFSRKDWPDKITDGDEDEIEESGTNTVLAAESYSDMPMLFAQHIFSAFMCAVAGMDEKRELFQDVAGVKHNTSGDSTWKSFTLRNAALSTLVLEIESTGLGNLADIYLSVIPPLSDKNKLPQADDAIIGMAREQAKQHEQLQHWEQATETYVWLFRTANTHRGRGIITKATAFLMEYLRQISSTIDLMEWEMADVLEPLKDAKKRVEEELNKSADRQILSGLMALYAKQGREWKCAAIEQGSRVGPEENSKQLDDFNFTGLHQIVQSGGYVYLADTWRSYLVAKDIHHWTPLHYAARMRYNSYVVQELLDAGADVNSKDLNGYTPLHYACQFSMEMDRSPYREIIIDQLILEGADVNSQGRDGMTPLHYASMEGNKDIASVLIEAGASTDIQDASGNTPLLWAVRQGAMSSAQNLWEVSNKRLRDYYGRTALHLAALSGVADVAEWLITKGGADKEAKDRAKYRPLHWAALNGHERIVDILINKGAAKDSKSSQGITPLYCAATNGHTHVMALLIKYGLEINDECEDGSTALHSAAEGGHEEAVALLIQQGADKDAQLTSNNAVGITPLHQAAEKGYEKVAALLIQHGANPDARTEYGMTPLHKASQGGHENIVKLLIGPQYQPLAQ